MHTRSRTKKVKAQSLDQTPDERKTFVAPQLEEVVELEDTFFARALYHDLASDPAIDTFLKKSRFYSLTERRWKIPRNYTKLFNNDSFSPVLNVISSIVKWFWADALAPTAQAKREVIDTHLTDFLHSKYYDPPSHSSRPSFVIKAEGPSFQLPPKAPGKDQVKVGFSNVAGCIELQVEGDALPVHEQLARVAIYARYSKSLLRSIHF